MWHPQNHQTFKNRKHVLMRKLVDNGTSMSPKWILILEILGVKVVYVDP